MDSRVDKLEEVRVQMGQMDELIKRIEALEEEVQTQMNQTDKLMHLTMKLIEDRLKERKDDLN
tara:strand:- start:164 stop:352 length:189 start_codon:yes stop_codon:yes gene_type:complete